MSFFIKPERPSSWPDCDASQDDLLFYWSFTADMRFTLAHINPHSTAIYNVVETRNPFMILLVYTYLFDHYRSSGLTRYVQFHDTLEEAIAAAHDW